MSILQEQLNELGSMIIDVQINNIMLTGFMYPERLLDYLETGDDCRYSVGAFPKEEYDIAYIKDNALCIVKENGIEISRYNFKPIKRDTVKYKDEDNNPRTKIYTIRHCIYSHKYNYKDKDKSILFDNIQDLTNYFTKEYNTLIDI